MQKVEGSNPFSRFFVNALHVGGWGSARVAETKWIPPAISGDSRLIPLDWATGAWLPSLEFLAWRRRLLDTGK